MTCLKIWGGGNFAERVGRSMARGRSSGLWSACPRRVNVSPAATWGVRSIGHGLEGPSAAPGGGLPRTSYRAASMGGRAFLADHDAGGIGVARDHGRHEASATRRGDWPA
jgi:hypothetical protein